MKKLIILCLLILSPILTFGQIRFQVEGTVNKKLSSDLKEGASLRLVGIEKNEFNYKKALVKYDGGEELIDINQLEKITFQPKNTKEFWQVESIKNGVYEGIVRNGPQYKLRKELEEEALEYIDHAEKNNLIFKDSYLESYLYSIAYKILPNRIDGGRPGIINVKILKSTAPNAFIFPNGTMFISTGLLSTINSKEELIGVMAHEISHFVLDHSIDNINENERRKKRAEFWAALATGVAAAADIYASSQNKYYSPGILTASTAMISFSIASEFQKRMGAKYSREQELEADASAAELMKFIDIDPTALSSALLKIKEYSILTGNYLAISGKGTHPAIDDRVENIGVPVKNYESANYDKTISFVNSYNAILQLNDLHLEACSDLVNRNIKAGIATEDDYILLSMVTTFMHDNEKTNKEALGYIQKAKTLNVAPSINIHKQEALVLMRLGRYSEANMALKKYLESIEKEFNKIDQVKNPNEWSYINNYLYEEEEWTAKMIYKVSHM